MVEWSKPREDRRVDKRRLLLIAGASTAAAALFVAGHLAGVERFTLDLNRRELAWIPLWEMFSGHWLKGIGFGLSGWALSEAGIKVGPHSLHLGLLSELGVIGYGIVVAIWGWAFWKGYKSLIAIRSSRANSNWATFLLRAWAVSVLGGIFVHQFFEFGVLRVDYLNYIWSYVLFYTLAAGDVPTLG